jgi:hypothetical protein
VLKPKKSCQNSSAKVTKGTEDIADFIRAVQSNKSIQLHAALKRERPQFEERCRQFGHVCEVSLSCRPGSGQGSVTLHTSREERDLRSITAEGAGNPRMHISTRSWRVHNLADEKPYGTLQ